MKTQHLIFCFLIFSLISNGQNLKKLDDGIIIKDKKYLDTEFNIETQLYILGSVTLDIAQIYRKEYDYNNFNCKAIIQTKTTNGLIEELYFENIEPVGSSWGICFIKKQLFENYIVGSKYGGYDGSVIIIDQSGKIIEKSGGNYFISEDRNYLISNWHSDLSGITVFAIEKNEIVFSKELPVYLSDWYVSNGKYYSAEWFDKELENVYVLEFDSFTFTKTDIGLTELHQFKLVIEEGCKPN